jgi:uracil-DNA glycosylase family protein
MPAGGVTETAAPFVPAAADLAGLRAAATGCRGCHLYEHATQTVFGEGRRTARVVLVGEQPGDQEDRAGRPFVGPAGKLLDKALADAGVDRADAYVTNAVKHFKFAQSAPGKRRLHQKPDLGEMAACAPWLAAELALLRPDVVVTLGATAGQALFGKAFRVTQSRGVVLPWPPEAGPYAGIAADADTVALATIHPSAVLRGDSRDELYAGLVADLTVAAHLLAG